MWLVGKQPSDINRRVMVSVGRETTLNTNECILRFSIVGGNVAAARASLTGIGGVHKHQGYSCESGFIFYFLSQVAKRPSVQPASLRATSPYPLANARQILKGYCATGALCSFYKLLTNLMINVFNKSCFSTRQSFQNSLGRLRSFRLKPSSLPVPSLLDGNNMGTAIEIPITIDCNIVQPQINTQSSINIYRIGSFDLAGNKKIKFAANKTKISLPSFSLQELFCSPAAKVRNFKTAVYGGNRNYFLVSFPGKIFIVVWKCTELLKFNPGLFIYRIGVAHLRYGTNGYLGGKPTHFPCSPVNDFLQGKTTEHFFTECFSADPITTGISFFKGFEKYAMLPRLC